MEPVHIFFQPPLWILHSYDVNGILEVFANSVSIYLVIFKSLKLDNFRFYLLWFQICVASSEIFVTLLLKPIFLLPIRSFYAVGILTTVFNVSAHYWMVISIALVCNQQCALAFCFLRKHYSISHLSIYTKYPKSFYICWCFLAELTFFLIVGISIPTETGRDKALDIISKVYPEYLEQFLSLNSFAFYTPSIYLAFLMFISGIALTTLFTCCLFFTVDMLHMLKKNERKLSRNSLTKHKIAIRGLIIRLISSLVTISQFGMLEIVVVLKLDYGQTIIHVLLILLGIHSTLNLIVLTTAYQPYRQYTKSLITGKKPPSRVSHVFVTTNIF